jgi:spore maturation protein CgeB
MSEDERNRLGMHARERILSEHTSAHRATQFEDVVAQCYAGKASAALTSSPRD